MARNQLPEGVGKKIVEALKKQAEADITPVPAADSSLNLSTPAAESTKAQASAADKKADVNTPASETLTFNDVNFEDFKEAPSNTVKNDAAEASSFEIKYKDDTASQPSKDAFSGFSFEIKDKKDSMFAPAKETFSGAMFNVQNRKDDIFAKPVQENYANSFKKESVSDSVSFKSSNEVSSPINFNNQLQYSGIPFSEEQKAAGVPVVTISIPSNVAVLKNLIASLPVGVTKQTGAQIIRQTLEAMGLPMASVLKEAQEVQEELNTNTRECMLKIQEYKTNIMQLEQSVQEYQKNMNQINDLVSLFLLTDRKV